MMVKVMIQKVRQANMPLMITLQLTSEPNISANFKAIRDTLKGMVFTEPTLLVLPECFAYFGARDKDLIAIAEERGEGEIQQQLKRLARDFNIWLVAGTIPLKAETDKFTASSLVIDNTGEVRAEYQKIHLFDVQVNDNTGNYQESRYTKAGAEVCVVEDTPFGRLGVAVCYDLRFSGQFMNMGELDVLAIPAAFTERTGKAHWHPLIQARSIENQCYIVAANQAGIHANGRRTYGHSCIYSPWGELQAEVIESPGLAYSSLNFSYLDKIRATMPVKQQNRFRSRFV